MTSPLLKITLALLILTLALCACSGDCTTATEKTYTPTATLLLATESPSCPQADERFTVDTAAIIARFAGGSATHDPTADGDPKPDYIPATITIGPYTQCLLHTEKADPHTDCAPNNYFKLSFGVSQEEIEEICFTNEQGASGFIAIIKTPLTDGTICKFGVSTDVIDGGECAAYCYNPTKIGGGERPNFPFIWHAPTSRF